jgi:hypothetical protein
MRIKVLSESALKECERKQRVWVSVARHTSTSKMGGVGIALQGARGVWSGCLVAKAWIDEAGWMWGCQRSPPGGGLWRADPHPLAFK